VVKVLRDMSKYFHKSSKWSYLVFIRKQLCTPCSVYIFLTGTLEGSQKGSCSRGDSQKLVIEVSTLMNALLMSVSLCNSLIYIYIISLLLPVSSCAVCEILRSGSQILYSCCLFPWNCVSVHRITILNVFLIASAKWDVKLTWNRIIQQTN
jgi:hypothetical protein